ncbi:DUF6011 domain-containing protein [Nonomuraea fuscirosea]
MPATTVKPGVYTKDGQVYEVKQSRRFAGSLTIKRLEVSRGRLRRRPSRIRVEDLSSTDMITEEQAAAFGHEHGICACCGRALSDPESVAKGIGPVCLANLRRMRGAR